MNVELLCAKTGERCWNISALGNYARRMTASEISFAEDHPECSVQAGAIDCAGVVVNDYGLGKVCLPNIEPGLVIYGESVHILPGSAHSKRDIPGFQFVKPDGSTWSQTFGQTLNT